MTAKELATAIRKHTAGFTTGTVHVSVYRLLQWAEAVEDLEGFLSDQNHYHGTAVRVGHREPKSYCPACQEKG